MGIFNKKIQTVGTVSEFLSGEWKVTKDEKQALGALAIAPIVTILNSSPAFASGGFIQKRIMDAFEPIVDLLQGISYPVGLIMLTGGMLLVMVGQQSRGVRMIKWAAIGYIGMQFVPALMEILVDIGKGMRGH